MRPGSHAAGDGSFGRSAGIQVGRAVILIALAVLIGFFFLHRLTGASGGPVSVGSTPTTPPPTSAGTGRSTNTTTQGSTTNTTSSVAARAPQDIKVLVANGTVTPGLAGKTSNTLHAKGYVTLASVNSPQRPSATIVYFQPSYSADAVSLASKLGLSASAVQAMAQPPPVSNLNGANILVVVGPDLAATSSTTTSTT